MPGRSVVAIQAFLFRTSAGGRLALAELLIARFSDAGFGALAAIAACQFSRSGAAQWLVLMHVAVLLLVAVGNPSFPSSCMLSAVFWEEPPFLLCLVCGAVMGAVCWKSAGGSSS